MTTVQKPLGSQQMPYRSLFITAAAVWSMVALAIFFWDRHDRSSFLSTTALSNARATFEKDIAFRRWAAKHGGVYVPATEETTPNPYLSVPERDIATPSGRQLTLMNPAYMSRQIFEISRLYPEAPQGHITSLNPIRPENAPDPWERKALEAFNRGETEFSEFQSINGKPYFRFMHQLIAEKPCLKCHATQGYREGDIRGGISISLPVSSLITSAERSSIHHSWVISLVWLLGTAGLWLGLRRIGLSAQAVQESEERYRQQFQQSQAVMLIIDPVNNAIVDANPAACSYYGYSHEALLALRISDIDTCTAAELATCISEVLDGSRRRFIVRHRLSDTTISDVEVFSNPVLFQGKTLLHSIIVDITGRLVAERELRDKMDFAENLILNSTTPTFVINSDHQVLIWNHALEELTGVKAQELIGTDGHWRAFYPAIRPCLADLVLDGRGEDATELYSRFSRSHLISEGLHAEGNFSYKGRRCRLVFSAAPIRDRDGRIIAAIETLEDITERISLETQLFQSQKMESVGVLAGGIAHDFNNVLTVINGYADLLKFSLPEDDENIPIVREISASVERAANMTRSLLAFSGNQEVQLQYDDLNQILTNIRKSLVRLIREDISLTIRTGEERLPVYVDRVQIEQMLINLVVNARDAMGTGGTILVSALPVQHEQACHEGAATIPPGRFIRLSVSDSGAGMDNNTLEHIFEPFFTTKARGKGTGLGLSIVHSIMTKHNGHISVISAPEKGSEFHLYLPQYSGEESYGVSRNAGAVIRNGTEVILVVEDDAAIMKLHRNVLGRYGYTVLAAADGIEAIEVFNAYRDEIRIVLVDVIMPRMNGREVVEQIREQRPGLPIIMTSGYTDDIIDRVGIEALNVLFLQKPAKPSELLTAIRSCLQADAGSANV